MRLSCASPVCVALVLAGCGPLPPVNHQATVLDGSGRAAGQVAASGLAISGGEVRDLASEEFGVIELAFRNPTSDWIRIDRVDLGFGGPAQNAGVRFPSGAELQSWYIATRERNAAREARAQTGLFFLGLAGAVVGASSHHHGSAAVGNLVALGASVALDVRQLNAWSAAAHADQLYPDNHLFTLPVAVPPRLGTRRWILVNTSAATPCLHAMIVHYTLADGRQERIALPFRGSAGSSEWQRSACSRT